jgi:hypothetical protein
MELAEIAKQYLRAKRNGWLPYFEEAAKEVSFVLDTADLLAIASRESNLDPKWLTTAGDRGNGYGLMQADKRYFPEWVRSGKWKDAQEGITKGAEILAQKWADLQDCIGKKRGVPSSKTGKISFFIGKDVKGAEARRVLIASYNCGRWAHYAVSNGKDVDAYSTGKDYSKDVILRAAAFRALLVKELAAVTQEPGPISRPGTNSSVVPDKPSAQPPTLNAQMNANTKTAEKSIGHLSDIAQKAQSAIDHLSSFETSVSKSSWTVTIVKFALGLVAMIWGFAKENPVEVIAGVCVIAIGAWYLTRAKDRARGI